MYLLLLREELLENDSTLVKKCDEELRGLLDMSQKSTTEEMQKAFHRQQQLYETLFQSKMNIIPELQQELESKNKTHLDILKRNEEDINVMTEQMKEQMQLKVKEYREELIQKVRHHQEEISAILSNDMEEWDQGLKKVLDREDVWLRGEKNGDDNGDNGVTCLPRWTLSSQLWQ
ncbi:dynein regulatory complex protein 1-like isoform X2 [Cyprinodon tularosa]|uniref:dynein regulatory complex protein 1-like isoform X2 n=1 Tax=Cyprinodon tularosa TaxID=77115 RepID=UPI0018E20FCD|nr:dynein regulatory complex protein 1-like isoform X2 [Cyprinodon tularosa]